MGGNIYALLLMVGSEGPRSCTERTATRWAKNGLDVSGDGEAIVDVAEESELQARGPGSGPAADMGRPAAAAAGMRTCYVL